MQTELSRSTEAQEICVQPRDYRSKDCMSEMHNALGMIMLYLRCGLGSNNSGLS